MSIPRPYRQSHLRSSTSQASTRVQPFGGRALSPLPRVATLAPRSPRRAFSPTREIFHHIAHGEEQQQGARPALPAFAPATFRLRSITDEKIARASERRAERLKQDPTASCSSFFGKPSRSGPIWREPVPCIEDRAMPVWITHSGGRLQDGSLPLRRAYVPDEQSHLVLNESLYHLGTGKGTPFQGRF